MLEIMNNPGKVFVPEQSFDSYRESENLLRYITRTRANDPKKGDLIAWSGRGVRVEKGIERVIKEFECVQRLYVPKGTEYGRHCFHEFYCLRKEYVELLGEQMESVLCALAEACMTIYWHEGFQVVCAIHKPHKNTLFAHIHFAVNAVCFADGTKWHSNGEDRRFREYQMNQFVVGLCPLWEEVYGSDNNWIFQKV